MTKKLYAACCPVCYTGRVGQPQKRKADAERLATQHLNQFHHDVFILEVTQ